KRVDWALRTVGMEEYRKSAPHMLSGGQKQRIAIAGVIAMLPEVIVFDESTSMLDPSGRQDVFNLARRLNKENNVTVLWITHFMEEAAACDRVIVMDHGKVMMDGAPREVFSETDKIEKYGLEAPDMAKLAKALKEEGLDLKDGIITVDEMEVELCRLLSKI
ncbi:MAG: ATP-binding cassette domain-containing protein, partial [Clostridia bacterium]|nr:ATP-binding cassette domain-containing protein [Clostridia bacterium]